MRTGALPARAARGAPLGPVRVRATLGLLGRWVADVWAEDTASSSAGFDGRGEGYLDGTYGNKIPGGRWQGYQWYPVGYFGRISFSFIQRRTPGRFQAAVVDL